MTKKDPGRLHSAGVSEELQSTNHRLARCARCGHHISAAGSVTRGYGPDCRRQRRSKLAAVIVHLAGIEQVLPDLDASEAIRDALSVIRDALHLVGGASDDPTN